MANSFLHANGTPSSSATGLGSNGVASVRHRYDRPVPSIELEDVDSDVTPKRSSYKGKERATEPRWRIGQKGWIEEYFKRFGEHVTRNQIRTLLIDCLVMTHLFYPSLAIYLQKRFPPLNPPAAPNHDIHRSRGRLKQKEHPLSLLSTPILDSFFPYAPPILPRLTWGSWWEAAQPIDHQGWAVAPTGGPGGGDDDVRILRIAWADVGHVLDRDVNDRSNQWSTEDHRLLSKIHDLVESWETSQHGKREACVRHLSARADSGREAGPVGACYFLSPDWDHPGSYFTTLGQLSTSNDNSNLTTWQADDRIYHGAAAVLRVPRANDDFEDRWLQSLSELAEGYSGEVFTEARGPRGGRGDQTGEWMLALNQPQNSSMITLGATPQSSHPSFFIILLYLALCFFLASQITHASKVHSRIGLAVTGIVQLSCSTIMSFSILSLLGWNGWGSSQTPQTLPSYILPFVILVVGVENMSTLTKAVFSVPFTLPVPVRIGLSLGKVGTRIAITSLADIGILSLVWLCVNLQPVREFCVFAIVVTITDWFMLHTFYLTVLSIDAQRLELADVLANPDMGPAAAKESHNEDEPRGWRSILRARTVKSVSLLLLSFCVGVVYYVHEQRQNRAPTPAGLYGYSPTRASASLASAIAQRTPFVTTSRELVSLTSAEKFWRALNPEGWPFVRTIISPASIIVLPRTGHSMLPLDIRKLHLPATRLLLPRLKPLFYLFKVVILPQLVTATALYILLLYLLKDADLLEAQRNRLGRGEVRRSSTEDSDVATDLPDKGSIARNLSVDMLPGSHIADIDIATSSQDGKVVISVGVENSISLWRFADGVTGIRQYLTAPGIAEGDLVVAVAVSRDGAWIAAATVTGVLQIWHRLQGEGDEIKSLDPLRAPEGFGKVKTITFEDRAEEDPFAIHSPAADDPTLLITSSSGASLVSASGSEPLFSPQKGSDSRNHKVYHAPSPVDGDHVRMISTSADGYRLWYRNATLWSSTFCPLKDGDRVTAVGFSTEPGVIAIGHSSGVVDLCDGGGTKFASICEGLNLEPITRVAIASPSTQCVGCGSQSTDGFFVISSTAEEIFIDRIISRSPFCRCAPARRASFEDFKHLASPSRSSKHSPVPSLVVPPSPIRAKSSPNNSPPRSPSLLPRSNGDFPLSSHGIRRLSAYRDDPDSHRVPSPLENPSSVGLSVSMSNESQMSNPEVDIMPLGGISSSSGGWVVLQNEVLVGLRRSGNGVNDSSWQVYTVDLTAPWNGSSLIVGTANLSWLAEKTVRAHRPSREIATSDRRRERLLSFDGKASFPSMVQSASVPTYPPIAYIDINPIIPRGERGNSLIVGLGNRLAVISLPERKGKRGSLDAARKLGSVLSPPPRRTSAGVSEGGKKLN